MLTISDACKQLLIDILNGAVATKDTVGVREAVEAGLIEWYTHPRAAGASRYVLTGAGQHAAMSK